MSTPEFNQTPPPSPIAPIAIPEVVTTQPEIHLAEYWAILVKRRTLIIISTVLAVSIGMFITYTTRPTYVATTTLDLEPDRSAPMDVSNGPQLYVSYDEPFQLTQAKLIKSRQLAERVVERLNLTNHPEFNPAPKPRWFGLRKAAPAQPLPRAVLVPAIANALRGGISVTPQRGSNVFQISYVATSPKLAADIVNATVDAYIDWNLESKFEVIGQASAFLTAQIEQIKREIDTKEGQLQAYGKSKDIISVDPQSNVTMQNLQSLNNDYANAMADRVGKEARYRELQNARAETIADSVSSTVAQLRAEQGRLEREYSEKLNLYKPDWPAMQQLHSQIENGRRNLETTVQEAAGKARDMARNDYLTALRREENLKSVLQGQKSAALALNVNAVEYNNLKTEVETKRALLDVLLKRNAEAQVASRLRGERLSNVRIVDRALPGGRFKPNPRANAAVSLLIGMAIGIGLAFFLEYLDRSLRTAEQVERVLRLPALGLIPSVSSKSRAYGYGYGNNSYYGRLTKTKKNAVTGEEEDVPIELLPHEHPRSAIAEAYRAFRTSILLSRAGGIKTIAVTSTLPSEGKTTTAVNLAVVLGQLGRRVLLIEADLHKPRLHELFRISNRIGLVSVLAENVSLNEVIAKTSVPGVFVIPSGPNSPNPSGLLSSDSMKKLLQLVAANFDHVILDTPPVSLIADAILIGALIDGIVLTVLGGRTPREQVARTRDKLQRAHVRILGVLINNLEEDTAQYGKYYSYYSNQKTESGKVKEVRGAARS